MAFPVRHQRGGPPAPPGTADVSPAQIHLVAVATGEHTIWQAGSDGSISHLSFSADGHRMAFSWHGAGEDNGIQVVDLPGTAANPVCTTPSHLVIAEQNSLGNLGQAVHQPRRHGDLRHRRAVRFWRPARYPAGRGIGTPTANAREAATSAAVPTPAT